ncbi:hypothetical protein NKR19_g5716 [Coniochaeta hoffmannii]|uniref:Uncharacterized protein n=1 Tax=Coniochaeta hoffmannii TaxID=91930 RepID=A0AA38RWW6_9PEZI|nr:hypothetical protein NKR19_g5716 [Coniochaeta hoffmannii]
MSCFSCGFRLFGGKRAVSVQPTVEHDDVDEQPRPYSGSTAVDTSAGVDTASEERKAEEPEKRSRSRSVSQRLTVSAEAFTTALRDRARSRSRSKSLLPPPKKPSEEDEKNLPSLPPSDEKPPKLSLEHEKSRPLSLGGEKTPPAEHGDEKPPRVDPVTVTGPAWPLREGKEAKVDGDLDQRLSSSSKGRHSIDSLDTPTTADFSDHEKKRVSERLSMPNGDSNRDSKLKDEGLEDDVPEMEPNVKTEERERKRKMRESRQKLKLVTPKDEQDRLDMFQCM